MFDNKLQLDVSTVLLLLGEGVLWKAIWGRFCGKRRHWRQWIFAVSLGWAPLAFTVFATINGFDGPPNLIFNMPPPHAVDTGLMLTHLSSGASHPATNVVLQNIWHAWKNGPRRRKVEESSDKGYHRSKETGLVDIDIDTLQLQNTSGLTLQLICLIGQFVVATAVGSLHSFSYEPLVALCVALTGQLLLLVAVTPSKEAWDPYNIEADEPCPIMLHKGLESNCVLIIRASTRNYQQITLEKFCFESSAVRNRYDVFQLFCAGLSCCALVIHIVLVGWMTDENKLLYFITGLAGLLANAVEGAWEPDWSGAFESAFKGEPICSQDQSGLMAAVAVLVAGGFAEGQAAAKLLYPNNKNFDKTLIKFEMLFAEILCEECQQRLNPKHPFIHTWDLHASCKSIEHSCARKIRQRLKDTPSDWKYQQTKDALCAIYNCIRRSAYEPEPEPDLPLRLNDATKPTYRHMTTRWHSRRLHKTAPSPAARDHSE